MTSTARRAALLGGLGAAALAAPALGFPERSVRIISGFNPGGLNDIVSRAMAQALTPVLGQSVVVENRAGAGGSVGATAAARAAPDGHTLWMGIVDTQAILATAMRNLPYDPERDFAPISFVANVPFTFVVGPSQPNIRDFAGLMAAGRARAEAISFASWGVTSTSHLAMERVLRQQRVSMLHVPFTGQAPGMQAIIAGQVDCMALPAGGAETMTRDGRVRGVAVAAKQRIALMPQVPTVLELGGELDAGLWKAIYAPARTPAPVLARLNQAVHEAMRNPQFVEVLRGQGAVPEPSTPEQLAELQRRERAAWAEVVRATNAFLE
jgi:tripartite-type tricarboxylate transporter receptor subunit TctC